MKHIIDTDELEKVLNKYEGTSGWASALCDDLRQWLANSPQADGINRIEIYKSDKTLCNHLKANLNIDRNILGYAAERIETLNVHLNNLNLEYKELKKIADEVLKDAWISVKDRLPAERILVITAYEEIVREAFYGGQSSITGSSSKAWRKYDGTFHEPELNYTPTHWQASQAQQAQTIAELVEALEDAVGHIGYISYISDDEKENDSLIIGYRALIAKLRG